MVGTTICRRAFIPASRPWPVTADVSTYGMRYLENYKNYAAKVDISVLNSFLLIYPGDSCG